MENSSTLECPFESDDCPAVQLVLHIQNVFPPPISADVPRPLGFDVPITRHFFHVLQHHEDVFRDLTCIPIEFTNQWFDLNPETENLDIEQDGSVVIGSFYKVFFFSGH